MLLRARILVIATSMSFAAAAGAAETLNIKTGLWEVTTITQTKGMPPLPKELLDRMTPEKRKQMEADIRAAQSKPDKDTDKECITQRDIERPFETNNTKECDNTIVTSTRTTQHIRIVCTGGMPGTGSFKVTAASPEAITGVLDLKLGQGAESMTINAEMTGRWLGSDCGDEADADDADADGDDDSSDP